MTDYELFKTLPFAGLAIFAGIKAGLLYASLIFLFTFFHYLNIYYKNPFILYPYLFVLFLNVCVIIYILINSTEYFVKRIIIGILLFGALLCMLYGEISGYLVLMGISFLYTIIDRDVNTIVRKIYYD
tara:strand:- start:289 stop:672 length:384 start_codon:yes stop_codon:yes gene_type:complete